MHTVEEVCSRLCFIVDLLCFICDCSTFGVLCRSKLHLFGFLSWRSLLFSRGPPQRPTSWWCCPQSDGCFALYHLRKRRVQDNHVGWAGAHFRSSDLHHRRAARCGLNKAWNHTHTPRLVGTCTCTGTKVQFLQSRKRERGSDQGIDLDFWCLVSGSCS